MERKKAIAVITGASSGIGEEFTRQLAAMGYDLIITARTEKHLKIIAGQIGKEYQVDVEVVTADLSLTEGIDKVKEAISEKDNIEVLVNNAGFGTAGLFAHQPLSKPVSMLNVHIQATTILSHTVLRQMVENKKGYIVNVSSVAAFLSSSYNVTYTSTKAYLNSFSLSLAQEVETEGIEVQALCPGFTYSQFHDNPEYKGKGRNGIPGYMWLDAKRVVSDSLNHFGSGKVIVIPSLRYKLIRHVIGNPVTRYFSNLFVANRRKKIVAANKSDKII